jgi:putrescine aminotransferase
MLKAAAETTFSGSQGGGSGREFRQRQKEVSAMNRDHRLVRKHENRGLLSLSECDELTAAQVVDLHREFINPSAAKVISSFSFGRDLIKSAEGVRLETIEGRSILDFTGGFGVLSHGHNHPRILAARRRYAADMRMEVHKVIFSPHLAVLSRNLASLLPGDLNKSFICNSGAEAVEGAIKLAFRNSSPRRRHILHADISFHGKLIGSGSVTASSNSREMFPQMEGTATFRYGDLDSVRALIDSLRLPSGASDVYAVIIEPCNASNIVTASREFLEGLRRICDREKLVLIFDEVYTGFGKCGSMFQFLESGVTPDILCLSKALGGGKASISAYVARDPIFASAYGNIGAAFLHSSTYTGFGEESATAIEAINIAVDEDHPGRARHIHRVLNTGLRSLHERYPTVIDEVRGVGAINGVALSSPIDLVRRAVAKLPGDLVGDKMELFERIPVSAVVDELYERHGILCSISQNSDKVLLLATPALIISDDEIRRFLDALEQCLAPGLGGLIVRFVAKRLGAIFG